MLRQYGLSCQYAQYRSLFIDMLVHHAAMLLTSSLGRWPGRWSRRDGIAPVAQYLLELDSCLFLQFVASTEAMPDALLD
jgi:hypothetical protein